MEKLEIFEYEWPYLLSFLPVREVLESSAHAYGAMTRKREIDSATKLLRLALVYGYCGMSLRESAAWARMQDVADLSDVALLKRLRNATKWLGHLLGLKLAERASAPSLHTSARYRIRLVDATCISKPGSRGTDWRLHVGFDLSTLSIDHIELTDQTGGESLTRFIFSPGELIVGDRGYAHRAGLHAVVKAKADFLVRIAWRNLPLQHPSKKPFDLLAALRTLRDGVPGEFPVLVAPSSSDGLPAIASRLLAVRKTESAATHARQEVLQEHSRKSRNVDPLTLEAAGYTFLLTSLPAEALPVHEGLELYRFRWQIELAFKRLKSLLELDRLLAKGPALAQATLFAKLLAALLVEDLTEHFLAFSPWGYRLET
jgi:IS4 transposase